MSSTADVRRPGRCGDRSSRRFRRYRLFGRFWRADWPRFRALLRLGLPIAGDARLRGDDLQRRRLPDGPDRRGLARRARHRHPDRFGHLHGAARPRTRRRPCASASPMAPAIRRASRAPAGPPMALGVSFMALMALVMMLCAAPADQRLHRHRRSGQRRGRRARRRRSWSSRRCSRSSTARRRWRRACCAACTIRACR